METEKKIQPIIMKSSRISYDYLRGKSNSKAIPEGNTPVEALRIKNPFNWNIRALGLQLRYKNALGANLIEIADNAGTPLISGDIQFAQIGNSSTADVIRDELPIDEELENLKAMYNVADGGIILCKEKDNFIAYLFIGDMVILNPLKFIFQFIQFMIMSRK